MHSITAVALLSLFLLLPVTGTVIPPEQQKPDFQHRQDLTGARGGNLVAALSADPSSFNLMTADSLSSLIVAGRISAGLVHINRSTFELEPSLAQKWELDKDGRSYTLHLRRGIRFSDGSPFSADDVVFSLQVVQDPKSQSVWTDQVRMDGAFPVVSKIDSSTVRIVFAKPVGMGLRCLDSIPMLPRARLFQAFERGRIAAEWGPAARPQDICGLGPFRLKEYRRGEVVVLERNPFYWKQDRSGQILPYLDTITFIIVPDLNSEALRFQAGELDVVNSLNPENYAILRRSAQERGYVLKDLGPGLAMDFLWFNLNPGKDRSGRPYVDPEKRAVFDRTGFRQAVSCGLDRDGMVRSILLGVGDPQFGPISSGNMPWYRVATPRTAYDPARARSLLAGAGLADADGDGALEFGKAGRPLEIDLLTPRGSAVRQKLADVIKENLSKIGIRIHTRFVLPNELVARLQDTFDYEAILFGFTPTDVAPDLQTDFWVSGGSNHFWHPGQQMPQRAWEAEVDTQISRLIHSLDPAIRRACFDRVQEIWASELPAIPTVAAHIITGHSNRVANTRPSILAPHLLWNAEELAIRTGGPGSR